MGGTIDMVQGIERKIEVEIERNRIRINYFSRGR